jgi:hypothetical protein
VETMTLNYQRFESSAVMFIFSHLFEDQSAAPSAEQTFHSSFLRFYAAEIATASTEISSSRSSRRNQS